MTKSSQLKELADLIRRERDAILAEWRNQVRELPSAKDLDVPTLNDHVPKLLEGISAALVAGSDKTIPEALRQESPPIHGMQRLQEGFDVEEVVAEYNILRGSIHNLAERHSINIQGQIFHVLNRVLDGAIGLAVQTYAEERAREVQQQRDEYLAFVVHDLRTPLSAVSLATTIIELQAADSMSDSTRQLFKTVGRNLAQLESLIAKIIEESVQTQSEDGHRLERRKFDLWPLVERLSEDLRPKLQESDIKFINAVPPDLMIFADAHLVGRILQNLVANAIQYTSEGFIEVGAKEESAGVVCCWVTDNGSGIPEALIAKVFDKLESDPSNEEGTGLGLAIVKSFVELHGGTITVESKTGSGSTFRFTLPSKSDS